MFTLNWKKAMMTLVALFTMSGLFLPTVTAYAESGSSRVTTNEVKGISKTGAKFGDGTTYDPNSELPSATIDQATDWADRKGSDATYFLQVGGQWIAIVMFIVSAVLTMFGAVGGKSSRGLMGVFLSVVMYAGITFAPTLIEFFTQWLAS